MPVAQYATVAHTEWIRKLCKNEVYLLLLATWNMNIALFPRKLMSCVAYFTLIESLGAGEMAPLINCFLHWHENLRLEPQNPWEKYRSVLVIACWGGWGRRLVGAAWPSSLARLVSSMFGKSPVWKIKAGSNSRHLSSTSGLQLACTHVKVPVQRSVHMHACVCGSSRGSSVSMRIRKQQAEKGCCLENDSDSSGLACLALPCLASGPGTAVLSGTLFPLSCSFSQRTLISIFFVCLSG